MTTSVPQEMVNMVFGAIVVSAALLSLGSAQTSSFLGDCPKFEGLADFDMSKLTKGFWYEKRLISLQGYSENFPKCSKTTFGSDLSVKTEFQTLNGTEYILQGHLKNINSKGGFNITYDNMVTGEFPYNVILADYDDFVFIFGCHEHEHYWENEAVGWLLSRTPELSKQASEKWMDKLDSWGFTFPSIMFSEVQQGGCKKTRR